jgi:hypothetical protein
MGTSKDSERNGAQRTTVHWLFLPATACAQIDNGSAQGGLGGSQTRHPPDADNEVTGFTSFNPTYGLRSAHCI